MRKGVNMTQDAIDKILIWVGVFLAILLVWIGTCSVSGCASNKAKSDIAQKLAKQTQQIDDNRSKIKGNENEINNTNTKITTMETKIETKITNQQEAFDESLKQEIGKVNGNVETKYKHVQNSMWYAFGLLIIIGVFGCVALFIFLWFWRGFKSMGRI